MYFKSSRNNRMHGIMFHHFHDNKKHSKIQGSISKDNFFKIIKYIGKENILDPDNFFYSLKKNENQKKVCFTFDDSLKSQIDVALPILHDLKIKSFFFIYTSVFDKKYSLFEVFRSFRNKAYKNIDLFYNEFEEEILNIKKINISTVKKKQIKNFLEIKRKFKFYSMNDICHRYYRDYLLTNKEYDQIMITLMNRKKFNINNEKKKILISKSELKELIKQNFTIGLHSHSHPTMIDKLSFKNQYYEYNKNKLILEKITKKKIDCVSYPNGKYNENSKKVMKKLNIKFGFLSTMKSRENNNYLEILREDHSNIAKKIGLKI